MPSSAKRGFDLNAGQTELTIKFNGSERAAFDATGTAFFGAAPVAQAAHIADPTGGATTDAEARTAIDAILVVLENLGFTATS